MKARILFLLAVLLSALSAESWAQEVSGVALGYCNGEMTYSGNNNHYSQQSDVDVSAAIFIPGDLLSTFEGNEIRVIRAALGSRLNVTKLTVWVRRTLDGENLAQDTIGTNTTPKIAKGWNEITLAEPYQITESDAQGLYVGYTYHQKSTTVAISTIAAPQPNAFFAQLPGEEWADFSDEACLSIEALVYGDQLPKVNLALSNLEAPNMLARERGDLVLTGTVTNLATLTVTGYDVIANVNGTDYSAHVDAEIPYKGTQDFRVTVNIPQIEGNEGTANVRIDNINEGPDENPNDNVGTVGFQIIEHDFTRNVLVEEFTTESCPNCPRVAGYLHDALEDEQFNGRVFSMCHHSGYYTDWLTIPSDNEYLWFYGAGQGTYAPAVMINRNPYGSEITPVFLPQSAAQFKAFFLNEMDRQAYVSVNVKAEYNATNDTVTVTVTGAKALESLGENTRIVVNLIENNIKARSQAGANSEFIHQHVTRRVNSTWGDELSFDGDEYTYSCRFPLIADYVRDNLEVIAYIFNYDHQSAINCEVHNVNGAKIGGGETPEVTPGDINGDGVVDASDVTALISIVLGETATVDAADVNGDGIVDASDVTAMIAIVLGN